MITALTHTFAISSDAGATAETPDIDTRGANLLVVAVANLEDIDVLVSDSLGNTWVRLDQFQTTSCVRLYYCLHPLVGANHAFLVEPDGTLDPSYPSIYVAAFSGAGGYEQDTGAEESNATSVAPDLTPHENNELVITAMAAEGTGAPYTVDSGFTLTDTHIFVGSQSFGGGLAYKIQTAAAFVEPTWTQANSTSIVAAIASFTAARGTVQAFIL